MTPPRADRLQTAAWAAVGLALLALFYALAPILGPFAVAAVFAYIFAPAVRWLVTHRVPRAAAVLLVIIGSGSLLVVLLLILAPTVYREAIDLVRRLPDLAELLNTRVAPRIEQQFNIDLRFDADFARQWISENWDSAQDLIPIVFGHLKQGGMAVLGFLASAFLVPIVMFYLLQDGPHMVGRLRRMVPRPMLARILRIMRDIDSVLSEFLRGQLSVMLLLALFYSVGLWLAGVKFALPVGVITGLLAFIPFVGFGGGLLLAILAALLQAEGWPPLIGVAVVYTLGQVIESYALTPYLVGERIGLHPLAVIFSLMAFGQLFGFVGVLVALPASAAILVALREVRTAWLASRLYRGGGAREESGQ
jgi:predicted PurR-regulated permease PerM